MTTQNNKPTQLPSKPSELILLALDDLEKVESMPEVPDQEVTPYAHDPIKFKSDMRNLAELLNSFGI